MGTKQIVINENTIRNMVAESLRKVLREFGDDDLAAGFADDTTESGNIKKEAMAVLNSIDFDEQRPEEDFTYLDWEYEGDHCYKAYDTAIFVKDGWKFDVDIYWIYNKYDETADWDFPKFAKVKFISPDGQEGEFEW